MTHGPDTEMGWIETAEEQQPPRSPAPDQSRTGAGSDGPPGRSPEDEQVTEISLLELGSVLLKHWKLVVGLPLIAAVGTAVVVLILPPVFTGTSSFVPESETTSLGLPSGVASLASQFGVAIPGETGNSPAFYAEVLRSRTLRDQVLLARFPDPRTAAATDSATLLDILAIDGDTEAERLENGREELEEEVGISVDTETNIVSLSADTHYPELSAAVANLFIALLNEFNLRSRQTNAQARRRFIEDRISQARAELRAAEEELKGFLERNRRFQNSPELVFQHDRLEREVSLKQEVLTTLSRQYEEARIQEVNDTPIITVVDRAVPPIEKSSPKRALSVIVAGLLGGVLGVFGAFGNEFLDRARQASDDEYVEFTSRWQAFKSELRSLLSRLRRRR